MSTLASALLAIAMLAAILLIVAGVMATVKYGERRRGLLMIVAALVLVGNVLIWTI